ncbi:MAG: thymidine kinase [Candidatus Pacebacteria bacterium]|nr:thymidine kinase [Candidatus Paceibacterota bacterium]
MKERGKLTVYTGPMYADKTTHLIGHAKEAGDNGIVFKPSLDDRFGGGDYIRSHNGEAHQAVLFDAKKPAEILKEIAKLEGISQAIIDEIQFCASDVVTILEKLLVQGLNVIVAGLDLDSEKNWFGSMQEIIEMADKVVNLTADCDGCGGDATLTYSKVPKEGVVAVGAGDLYGAACESCYGGLSKS